MFHFLFLPTVEDSHEVPWQAPLEEHSLLKVLHGTLGTRGIVSKLYDYILEKTYHPLPVDSLWQADIPDLGRGFCLGWSLGYSKAVVQESINKFI